MATEGSSELIWNDMVELVANDTFELGFTGFSQTYHRSLRTDFSLPFVSSSVRLFYKVTQTYKLWHEALILPNNNCLPC